MEGIYNFLELSVPFVKGELDLRGLFQAVYHNTIYSYLNVLEAEQN